MRALARVNRLHDAQDMAMAVVREQASPIGMRPFPVQLLGALAMCQGTVAEMATGEGKALPPPGPLQCGRGRAGRFTSSLSTTTSSQCDSEEMSPIYEMCGLKTGHVVHEATPQEHVDHYCRGVLDCTSKNWSPISSATRSHLAISSRARKRRWA